MSMGRLFCPICMVPVRCTVVLVVLASTNVVCTVPVAFIWPVQTIFAVIPPGVMETSVIWQLPRCGLEYGAPYLSIMAWVTHTSAVCGANGEAGICTPGGNCVPGGICGIWGMPAIVIWVVVSHR